MLRQAVQLAQDFGMFEAPRTQHHEWKKMNAQMQYVASITAHSIFILNSYVVFLVASSYAGRLTDNIGKWL